MNIVQFEGRNSMNTVVTSRDAILKSSKEIAASKGLQSLNMRDVAKYCNVAVGSVYNYFPSKAELVTATVEDIWKEIFHNMRDIDNSNNFVLQVTSIFDAAKNGTKEYPAFFNVHSMNFSNDDKERGRKVMNEYFNHIKDALLRALQKDDDVKKETFSDTFTQERFIDFVFSNILALLINDEPSCYLLNEVIKRTIY